MPSPATPVKARPSRASLADSIYSILFQQIAEGYIKADSPINIDSLARDLDVSPTPIREALARLEATGLVVREALRGYRAAPLFDAEQLLQLMDARSIIEPPLARLACSNADAEFVASLRANVATMSVIPEEEGHGVYREIDEEFHRLVAARANNPFLERAYESLEAHVHRFRLFGPLGHSDLIYACQEHSRIIDAIETGEPALAAEAMSAHVEAVRQRAIRDRRALTNV